MGGGTENRVGLEVKSDTRRVADMMMSRRGYLKYQYFSVRMNGHMNTP